MIEFVNLVSILATTASICMVGSPVVTVRKMEVQRSVGVMTPTFFCAQLANSVVWSIYGVIKAALGVILCNAIGNAVATYCLLVFLSVARQEELSGHQLASTSYKKSILTVGFCLAFVAFFAFAMIMMLSMNEDVAISINGLMGSFCSVFMLSSPLGMAGTIIRNKNAEGLAPLTMTFAIFNSILWFLYGAMKRDPYIAVPNFLGALACVFQFILLFMYGRRPSTPTKVKEAIAPLPFGAD